MKRFVVVAWLVSCIEVCDDRPTYVESHLADFLDVVKSYCPRSAKLVALRDYR